MWSVRQLCRCTPIRSVTLSGVNGALSTSRVASRHLITATKAGRTHFHSLQLTKIKDAFKANSLVVRLSSSSPQKPSKLVGYWLLTCSGMVFTAVVLGGVTRLTESGLSMVSWRLLGETLPRTQEQWAAEFENYKNYPEFKYKNQNMTLSEFKWIWWMEFAHRSWGRAIGAAMFVPAAVFWARGFLDRGMKIRVAAYCTLVACQGLMGWYMVQSGLEDRFQGPSDVPRVSQYRLAAHLSLAFILYTALLGGALKVFRPVPLGAVSRSISHLKGLVPMAHTVKAMAFLTAISGAFVAGLDAGLVYNSFPKMGDHWLPPEILEMEPTIRNVTENPVTVQFDHRVLGISTLIAANVLLLLGRKKPLPKMAKRALVAVGTMAWLQVSLGISTLVHFVPTPLAASHQAGSLALLTLAVWLTHELKLLKYIPK